MNLLPLITDDITRILIGIMEFTQSRQKLLTHNICEMRKPGFEPRDLAVDEFSESLNVAIEEYMRNNRLVFCDTKTIKFSLDGTVIAIPIADESSKELLGNSPDEYLDLQMQRLMENAINQRVAAELIRQRENAVMP